MSQERRHRMSLWDKIADVGEQARLLGCVAREKIETGIVFNPTDASLRSDPFPFYKELRERSNVASSTDSPASSAALACSTDRKRMNWFGLTPAQRVNRRWK